jgi:muramoyltetrapeptide carboxypeptidase
LDEYLYHTPHDDELKAQWLPWKYQGIVVGSMTKMKDNDIPWGKMHFEISENVTQKIYDSYFIQFPAAYSR